jgi:hypothetical protein
MRIKTFEKYDSPEDDEAFYNSDDYLFGRPYHGSKKKNPKFDDEDDDFSDEDDDQDDDDDYNYEDDSTKEYEEDDLENDDMQHLLYLLRTMFKNSYIDDVEIENKGLDISIYCYQRQRERFKDIIKIFELTNKLKRDILAQYDCEFEMWETKDGLPVFAFHFIYDEGLDDDNKPF